MNRFLPRTLFGQTLMILLVGLAASQLAGAWIYSGARQEAVRAVGGIAAAQRIANLVRLIEDVPSKWRDRVIKGSSEPGFRVAIAINAPTLMADEQELNTPGLVIASFLKDELPATPARQIRARIFPGGTQLNGPGHGLGMHPGMGPGFGYGPMRHWMESARGLDLAIQLTDARWVTVSTFLPDTSPGLSPRLILAIAVMAAIVGLVAALAVRRLTTPLATLSAAAARIGKDVHAAPLSETGTIEVRQAARALNDMQSRLQLMIEGRTNMLAAISHDLRTELQLLRLRVEHLEPPDEREKLLGTIAGMEAMLAVTLAFARDEATTEPRRLTDIGALAGSIVDDMADAGLAVILDTPSAQVIAECQPTALRRALRNLIDNAIKYGKRAKVTLRSNAESVVITVDDEGPGIPDAELGRVLQPFYRLETSRSRETGGIGLGLAITASIAEAHGGELTLANLPTGGLNAMLTLPV